jgi:hypothetical protein
VPCRKGYSLSGYSRKVWLKQADKQKLASWQWPAWQRAFALPVKA